MAKLCNIQQNNCATRQGDSDDIQLQEFWIVNISVSANFISTLALEFDVGPSASKSSLQSMAMKYRDYFQNITLSMKLLSV
jgi:hypothetical protein